MSDSENFSGVPENDVEEDPAAAFLAQEREQFAGLEEDLPNGEMNDNGYGHTNSVGGQFGLGDGDDFGQIPQNDFEPDAPQDSSLTTGDLNGLEDDSQGGGYNAISEADAVRNEPEKLRKWREEQKERLEKKDAEAEEKKTEWRQVAKKELEEWYKNREDQFVKMQETNRAHEAAFIEERDESVPGHEWEQVCRLCDFNPKNSKNNKDVSRLRSVLLQLKQTPLER